MNDFIEIHNWHSEDPSVLRQLDELLPQERNALVEIYDIYLKENFRIGKIEVTENMLRIWQLHPDANYDDNPFTCQYRIDIPNRQSN
jgi:hypothetical protein